MDLNELNLHYIYICRHSDPVLEWRIFTRARAPVHRQTGTGSKCENQKFSVIDINADDAIKFH